jgi:hypothetical protein
VASAGIVLAQEAVERLHDDGVHGSGPVGMDGSSSPWLVRRPAAGRAGMRSPEPVDLGADLDPCLAGCATNLDADQLGVAVVAAMPDTALGEGLEDEVHVGHTVMVAPGTSARIECQVSPTVLCPCGPRRRDRGPA